MQAEQSLPIEEQNLWVIDRIGDRNINPYSINSVTYFAIADYLRSAASNNIIYNDDVIPVPPLADVMVVANMAFTEEEKLCCVCLEDRDNTGDICRLNCAHTLCCKCVKNVMSRQNSCPLCRVEISGISVQNEENRVMLTEFHGS